jgi:preprotein translocase subunit SecD
MEIEAAGTIEATLGKQQFRSSFAAVLARVNEIQIFYLFYC